ncbi:MAG: sulfur carrier protein ThiS [Rectinemataceae bacterium]|nr:sulfur carrier protein ThiS [Spirochaetaceae bacterium]
MKLVVNHAEESFSEKTMTVRDLLKAKRWSFPLIIVKVNGRLVERTEYDHYRLADGDNVELYHLVSGG